jgi:hypothetical protein
MTNTHFEEQLGSFINGDPKEQYSAYRKLISAREHNKASKNKQFQVGLERLYAAVGDTRLNELDRLLALATIGRIAATIKSQTKEIYKRLSELLVDPLPSQQLLEEVDDRAYIGKICKVVLPHWSLSYAAKAVVVEDTGEQARQAFMQVLFNASSDLDKAVSSLVDHIKDFTPDTEEPGKSMAVKLRRIFSAIRGAMADEMPEPGENPGRSMARLIKEGFAGIAPPNKYETILAAAEEVGGAVHEMVRLRFSLATEAATYFPLMQIKDLVPAHEWETLAIESSFLNMVATDITEAIMILGKQGITDSVLAECLSIAMGSRKRAKAKLAALSEQPGLTTEVRIWLAKGQTGAGNNLAMKQGESQQLSDDTRLADLLVDAQRFQITEAIGREQILPEIAVLNPGVVNELERILNYGLGICDEIQSLAKQRGLRIRGAVGGEEDFSPLEHEVIDGRSGARRVRIIRPAVEQVRRDGISFVLRKGIVEPV